MFQGFLKQSTAVTVKVGPFVDSTDGVTAETGLTISQADVRLSKNGGDMAQKDSATALTHDEIGVYGCPLSTTDTGTVGILRMDIQETGGLPFAGIWFVLPGWLYDLWTGSSTIADTVLSEALSGHTTAGTLGKAIADIETDVTGVKAVTDGLNDPTAAAIADAVWEEALSGHTTAGSAGKSLADTESDAGGVKAKTDNLPDSPAAVGDIPTAVENADALLGRNIAGGSNGGRTVTSAFRRVRNRVAVAAGTMTVYEEDDSTSAWTAAITTAAGNPVSEVDPS